MDGPPLPVPDRDQLLIAFAVCEWDRVVQHLTALRRVGTVIPDVVLETIGDELTNFSALWATVWDQAWELDETVGHARSWLAEHQTELADLLDEEGSMV